MADWTNIPDATFDPDRPVLGSTHLAIVKNFEALTEGAVNAPKITNAALDPPTAGLGFLIRRIQNAEFSTDISSYPNVDLNDRALPDQHLGVTVLVSGVVTVYFEHKRDSGLAFTSLVRVLLNGSVAQEFGTGSTSYVSQTLNINVSVGDSITLQNRTNSPGQISFWRSLRIYSNTQNMAVS
jgi:hypothetical protein